MRPAFRYPSLLFFCAVVLATSCKTSQYTLSDRLGAAPATDTTRLSALATATPGVLSTRVASYLQPYHDSLDHSLSGVLIQSAQRLVKGQPESELGNLMADLMREMGAEKWGRPIDVAMTNNGGIRTELPAGPVTLSNVFEVMPFDNTLVVLTLPAEIMRQFIAYVAQRKEPQSGLRILVDKTSGKPLEISVNGQPFDSTRTYALITTDYIANSSDAAAFLKNRLTYDDIHYLYRDAIADYLRRRGQRGETLAPQKDGRTRLSE